MWNFTLEVAHEAPTLIFTFVKLDSVKCSHLKSNNLFLLLRDKNSFICVSLRPFRVNHFFYLSLTLPIYKCFGFVMEILMLKPFKIKMRAHIGTICGFTSFLISVYVFLRCLKNKLPGDDWAEMRKYILRHMLIIKNHPHTFTSKNIH